MWLEDEGEGQLERQVKWDLTTAFRSQEESWSLSLLNN